MTADSEKKRGSQEKLPAAGPHDKPGNQKPERTPGAGTLPKPGSDDPNDMAPTG